MATFMDMFNQAGQKLDQGFNSPWTQLGMQILNQSGWQPGDPGTGQRLGAAGMGYMEQRAQAAQAARLQQQQMLEQQKIMSEVMSREALRQRAEQDPEFMKDQPVARAVILSGGSMSDAKNAADLGGKGAGAPKMPYHYPIKNPDGTETQMIYDPQAPGGYKPGATYRPTSQQNVDLSGQRLEMQGAQGDVRLQQGAERLELDRQRLEQQASAQAAAQSKAAREAEAARIKTVTDKKGLTTGYQGAVNQIDKVITLIDQLKNHPGTDSNFGIRGKLPTVPGSDAADAGTLLDEFQKNVGLSELIRLKDAGVVLTPVSNTDLQAVMQAGTNMDRTQGAPAARQQLDKFRAILENAKREAQGRYSDLSKELESAPSQQSGPAAPTNQAEYDALPSGTLYIDPATGRQARKR